MQLHIAKPATIEYNDNDHSVYSSDEVVYAGLDLDVAQRSIRDRVDEMADEWDPVEISSIDGDSADLASALNAASVIDSIDITGVNTVADLDVHEDHLVVWVVADDAHGFHHFGNVHGAYQNLRQAADRVRAVCTEQNPHEYVVSPIWQSLHVRAVPVPVALPDSKSHTTSTAASHTASDAPDGSSCDRGGHDT